MFRLNHVFAIALSAFVAGTVSGKPDKGEPEPDAAVAKLITSLHSANFRARQDASNSLEKLGPPVLPALRKALRGDAEVETKRRIEHIIGRIETGIMQAEEKLWKDFDAPRRGIRDRLIKIMAANPTLTDQQVISAIYLVTAGRAPTEDELKAGRTQLADSDVRAVGAARLARPLVQGKEFNTELAVLNARILKAQADLHADNELGSTLLKLNDPEKQKLINDLGAATAKVVKSDEEIRDVTCLLTVSRYPRDTETPRIMDHLKRGGNRAAAVSDLYWALMSTKEFLIRK